MVASSTVPTEFQWTLRMLGAGEIAYVSNGDSGSSAHPSWENTSPGGAGAYNAALRNFAFIILDDLSITPTEGNPRETKVGPLIQAAKLTR